MREGWEYKKLGEVCSPKKDIERAGKCFSKDDVIQYIDISSLDNSIQKITGTNSFKFKDAPSRAQQCVKAGDVLVSLVRPNLKNIAIVEDCSYNLVASSGFCVLRESPLIDKSYLFYYINSDKTTSYLCSLTAGANYPAIREEDIRGCSIGVPPISIQKQIVAELDLLSSIIDKQKAQLKELDNLAQSIFYDMFGDPVVNEKGWEVKKMGEVSDIIAGGDKPSDLSDTKKELYLYPVIANGEGDRGILGYSKNYRISQKSVTIGSRGASIGNCRIVEPFFTPAVRLITLTPKQNLDCHYLFFYSKKAEFIINGAGQAQLTVPNVKSIDIPIPPLPLQQLFAEKIQAIESQKASITQSIAETQKLFDYTMDKYFG